MEKFTQKAEQIPNEARKKGKPNKVKQNTLKTLLFVVDIR